MTWDFGLGHVNLAPTRRYNGYLNIVKPLGKPSKKALTLRYLHGTFQNETFPFWILRFRDLGESWAWLWDMGFRLGIAIASQERVSTWSNNKIPFGKATYYIQLFYIFLYFPCLFCKIVNLLFEAGSMQH